MSVVCTMLRPLPMLNTYSSSSEVVAGMVTLYNSEPDVVQNIATYISQVAKLYVVDNSEQRDNALIKAIQAISPTVEYISNDGNEGIAYALNRAAEAALHDGFSYLLTMDDDSQVPEDMVKQMYNYIQVSPVSDRISMVAPQSDPVLYGTSAKSVWYVITSGSLLSLDAYKICGPFLEELFIDSVDHEYCFRMKRAGYTLVELNYLHLIHRLGEVKKISLMGETFYTWLSHSPLRVYYILRNNLYVISMYRADLPGKVLFRLVYALIKVCFLHNFLERDAISRFQYVGRAIRDYWVGRLGKYMINH